MAYNDDGTYNGLTNPLLNNDEIDPRDNPEQPGYGAGKLEGVIPEKPINIIGVGNKMAIQKPDQPWISEEGNPVSQDYVKKIQGNLDESKDISPEDQKYFNLKPPTQAELDISNELGKYQDHLKKNVFKGFSDPADIANNAKKIGLPAATAMANEYRGYSNHALEQLTQQANQPKTKTEDQIVEAALAEKLGRKPTNTELAQATLERKVTVAKATNEAKQPQISEDALKIEGAKYAMTGKMPAMGMGAPTIRAKIINAAADYLKEKGIDPSTVPGLQAEYAATVNAYNKVKQPLEQIKGFEGGMIKNADYALSLSDKYYRTSLPPVNKVINAIRTGSGDPQIVEFSTAVYAAAMEFEKIRTAGTTIGAQELSIGAQKKAEELISTSQNHEQLMAAIKAMKTDAHNITGARAGTLASMSEEMRQLGKTFENTKTPQQPYSSNKTNIPPRNEYFNTMKKANPDASDDEINSYLDKKGIK